MTKFDYLIIGNSAAAISAIESIRQRDKTGSIAVISNENIDAYSTPMISYFVKGIVEEQQMILRSEDFYEKNNVEKIYGEPASAIDPKAHSVEVGDKTYEYKKLLIACGAKAAPAPLEGLEGTNILPFMNLMDAKKLVEACEEAKKLHPDKPVRVAVIGSGLIGCKACEGLSYVADEVIMLARSPEILRSILDAPASKIAERALEGAGIEIRLSTTVKSFEKDGDKITKLGLSDGTTIDCDLVVLAAGAVPNCEIAKEAGISVEKGIVCNSYMQTNLEDIYAAGDVAQAYDNVEERSRIIALWPSAVAQGSVAGSNMAGVKTELTNDFALNSITLFKTTILSAGLKPTDNTVSTTVIDQTANACADSQFLRFTFSEDQKHLLGFVAVNRPEAVGIYTHLIREKVDVTTVNERIFTHRPEMIDLPDNLLSKVRLTA